MTGLEKLSAQLEVAVKMQENAERLYHKSAERIEEIKKQMLEVKEKNKPKAAKVEELFAAGVQARKALQEMCAVGSSPTGGTTPAARPENKPYCQAWQPEQGRKGLSHGTQKS